MGVWAQQRKADGLRLIYHSFVQAAVREEAAGCRSDDETKRTFCIIPDVRKE